MTSAQTVRLASPCDRAEIEVLLRKGFGDEEGFLCAFFAYVFPCCDTLISCEGNRIAAMAALIPCEICIPQEADKPALYLYSLTTHPDFRGRGHAKRLLSAAKEKCDHVFLHAADDSLFQMYSALGWKSAMYARYETLPPALPLASHEKADGDTYFALREEALRATPHIRWNKPTCRFLCAMLNAYGGKLYAASDAALAVIESKDGCLYIAEAFGVSKFSLAAAAAQEYGCSAVRLLSPCLSTDKGAFPMAQTAGRAFPSPLQMSFDFS